MNRRNFLTKSIKTMILAAVAPAVIPIGRTMPVKSIITVPDYMEYIPNNIHRALYEMAKSNPPPQIKIIPQSTGDVRTAGILQDIVNYHRQEIIEQYTSGPCVLCENPTTKFKGREGIVITPVQEQYDPIIRRKILKSVSVDYLEAVKS